MPFAPLSNAFEGGELGGSDTTRTEVVKVLSLFASLKRLNVVMTP